MSLTEMINIICTTYFFVSKRQAWMSPEELLSGSLGSCCKIILNLRGYLFKAGNYNCCYNAHKRLQSISQFQNLADQNVTKNNN